MQPIFKEQMEMWKAHGYDLGLSEGVYWFDNHFICAFTPDGELHKLFKYKVFDNLTLEIKAYKDKKADKINFLFSFVQTL